MSLPTPRFDVITLFPDKFYDASTFGVIGRALNAGHFELKCWNPRDFTRDIHKTVDDRPYGGGPGMVMLAEPLVKTLQAVRECRSGVINAQGDSGINQDPLVFLTPHAPLLNQSRLQLFKNDFAQGCIFLCGRYEGVDQRFIDNHVDAVFCLGDFVLSGGELPVACMIDAWVRLLPGVLNHSESFEQDSFQAGLLDYPHYTRPEVFEDEAVPPVLLSGNHAKISSWRFEKQKEFTKRFRPDLLISSSDEADDN